MHRYVEFNQTLYGFNAFIPQCNIYSRLIQKRVGPPAAGGGGTFTQTITSTIDPTTGVYTTTTTGPDILHFDNHVHDDPTTFTHAHRDYLDGSNAIYSTYDQDLSQIVDTDSALASLLSTLAAFDFNTLPANALSVNGSITSPWPERLSRPRAYNRKGTAFNTFALVVSAFQVILEAPGYSTIFYPIDCTTGVLSPGQSLQLHPLLTARNVIIYPPSANGFFHVLEVADPSIPL